MTPHAEMTRRALLVRAGVTAAAFYLLDPHWASAETAPVSPGWGDREYWAFADRMQALVEGSWDAGYRGYRPGDQQGGTSHNANLLYTHAAAARAGHTGPARQDERARILIGRLCESPPWRTNLPGSTEGCPSAQPTARTSGDQTHACGWGSALDSTTAQHVVIDTAVVRGLAQAYLARSQLQLPADTIATIRDRIGKAANSTFYAYPALRLNQINWPVEIYAHAVGVLGTRHLLRHDCRLQLSHFADALTRPAPGSRIPDTGPGYRFHYLPQNSTAQPMNFDSAEYGTIVCGALLFYGQARNAGMAALSREQLSRLRAWVERVLCGYWTHSGYLNWDTGLGFRRWHQVKKPPLCQQSLLAIALSPRFQPSPAHGRWAKYFFDRGLELFDRMVAEAGGLPPNVLFGVTRTPSASTDAELAAARMQANAAQAWALGLARVAAEVPPPLYAYDPDTGRLAITTPAYNTAIVAVNQGAFPYGGMELARLFDGEQRIAASIGGRPPAAFGVVVRQRRTGHVTASQRGRPRPDLEHPPLRLVKAPRGAVAHPVAYPARAYAGPFSALEAVGSTRGPTVTIQSRHRFEADFVQSTWHIVPTGAALGAHDVQIHFPTTGEDAIITAVLHDGSRRRVASEPIPLAGVAWFHLTGRECGYVVRPSSHRLAGVARLLHPSPQASAPHAGPTLVFELLQGDRLRSMRAEVRLAPARGVAEAEQIAAALAVGPYASRSQLLLQRPT